MYVQGLRLDPWVRSGHRFLADAEARLGRIAEAYRNSVLAVVSDPTYEAGWEYLRQFNRAVGGKFHRVRQFKAVVRLEDEKSVVTLPPPDGSDAGRFAWLAYGLGEVPYLAGAAAGTDNDEAEELGDGPTLREWTLLSHLERERYLVSKSLEGYQLYILEHPGEPSVLWELVARAVDAGYLDEAIYIHFIDRDLVPSYETYRAEHSDRLIEYIMEMLAPVPIQPNSGS